MSHVAPVDSGTTAPWQPPPVAMYPPLADVAGASMGQAVATSELATVAAMGRVPTAVTQLLQSIGGGIDNDPLLRAVIALLILVALLSEGNHQPQAVRALTGLGAGLASGSTYVGIYSSSTTVMVEYSPAMVYAPGTAAYPPPDAAASAQLDIAA